MKAAGLALLTVIGLGGCEAGGQRGWSGEVKPEIDDLTGARTGLYRTYGPEHELVAGQERIPVQIGYWCRVWDELEPLAATDGLFFKVTMQDTTLLREDDAEFEAVSGQLGLVDVARMVVDGRLYAWKYRPSATLGAWYLDGDMGFVVDGLLNGLESPPSREERLKEMTEFYVDLPTKREVRGYQTSYSYRRRRLGDLGGMLREGIEALQREYRELWPPAHDYVMSHYAERDTVGIELRGTLKFAMEGFDAARDSVRTNCPVPRLHHEWNVARVVFVGVLDSLQQADAAR